MNLPSLSRWAGRSGDFFTPGAPTDPTEAANIRHLCLEIAWWGIALGAYQSYLS
ncbi:MAG: hypothetical protein GX605_03485, partial [Chloroflexi bacterium]|nr:hypothetical protein [Chloroflexota bacterium]